MQAPSSDSPPVPPPASLPPAASGPPAASQPPADRPPLSASAEDYLKTLFKLGGATGPVATNDLADALGVAAASVTGMLKRLADLGLVVHRAYRGAMLSESGRLVALEVIRHHRLLERYLHEVVGLDWEQVHAEAEILEHHISEALEDRLDALLGHPTHDPHGDPIPTRDGVLAPRAETSLAAVPPGAYRVARLSSHDAALLGALDALGLLPGTAVTLEAPVASEGSGGLRLTRGGTALTLAIETARHVFVEPDGG